MVVDMYRGDVYSYTPTKGKGHEQQGPRFCVVLQSDHLHKTMVIIAPTSTSAMDLDHRPTVQIRDQTTLVMVEQMGAASPQRLGDFIGTVTLAELSAIEDAMRIVLDLA